MQKISLAYTVNLSLKCFIQYFKKCSSQVYESHELKPEDDECNTAVNVSSQKTCCEKSASVSIVINKAANDSTDKLMSLIK